MDVINHEISEATSAGAIVVYTADWHPASTPHFLKDGGIWPVHCVGGTWGSVFHPGMRVEGPVVRKGMNGEDGYSGYAMRDAVTGKTVPTELPGLLRDAGIGKLVVAGLATDYCVRSTVLDGLEAGLSVRVLTDAIRAVDLQEGDGNRAMEEIEGAGAVLFPSSA